MIYTSYFGNVGRLLKSGFTKDDLVGISCYKCKWLDGIYYEKRLMVDSSMLWDLKNGFISWREYCLKYYDRLYNLEWVFWENFQELFDGKVLLCYEKNYRECHRYLVNKFYKWYSGKDIVKEF